MFVTTLAGFFLLFIFFFFTVTGLENKTIYLAVQEAMTQLKATG
jgi:hypothetical protein